MIRHEKKRVGLYIRILFSFLIFSIIVISIISMVLYVNFKNGIEEQMYGLVTNNLYQLSQNANFMATSAKTLLLQLYYDQYVSKLFLYSSQNEIDETTALAQLNKYRNITTYVDSIYVYNKANGNFYISSQYSSNSVQNESEFYDREIIDIISNFRRYSLFEPISRIIPPDPKFPSQQESRDVCTFLFSTNGNEDGAPDSIIIVNISKQFFNDLIKKSRSIEQNSTLIFDHDNRLIYRNDDSSPFSDKDVASILGRIDGGVPQSGHFTLNINKANYLVVFTEPDSLGWRYVTILPYNYIQEKMGTLNFNSVLLIAAALILSVIYALLISRRLYQPIDQILKDLKAFETEKKNSTYTIRQELMRNIILDGQRYDPSDLRNKFEKLAINLDVESKFLIVLFKIDSYRAFNERYNSGDRGSFRFAIMNIAFEVFSTMYRVATVDMLDDRVVSIVEIGGDSYQQMIRAMIQTIQAKVAEYVSLSVSCTISSLGEDLNHCTFLFNQATEASFYRFFKGPGSVIFSEDILTQNSAQYVYPYKQEKQLTDAFLLGNMAGVESAYNEIMGSLSGCPYTIVNMTFSRLISKINETIDTIEGNNFPSARYYLTRIIVSLNEYETLNEVTQRVIGSLKNVIDRVEEKRASRHDDLPEKVMGIIKGKYMSQELSIELIADELKISSAYLGRLFKKYTSKTILDCITEYRMEKAKELLRSTNFAVAKIAEQTGFSNSIYFHRAFKKENGITPNEFRRNNQPG